MRVRALRAMLCLMLPIAVAGCSSPSDGRGLGSAMLPDFGAVPRQTEPPLPDDDDDWDGPPRIRRLTASEEGM